jgi:signal transduction histidine kinase
VRRARDIPFQVGETHRQGRSAVERPSIILAVVGLLAGLGAAWIMLGNEVRPHGGDVALVIAVGWSFVASGLVAWRLRPGNPIGLAMVVTGLLRFAEGLYWSQDPVLFTLGHAVGYLYMAGLVYVLLAFPTGWLESTVERGAFIAAVMATGAFQIAWLLTGGHEQSGPCAACPPNVLEIAHAPALAAAIQTAQLATGAVVGAIAIAIVLRRWWSASAPLRFAITPVIWAGIATLAALVVMVLNHLSGEPLGYGPHLGLDLTLALVALAFLVGLGRTRMARSGVADLLAELADTPAPGALRAALARALRDPSLEVAYWLPAEERYVDSSGKPAPMPRPGDARSVTMVEREDRRIAALVHDPAVTDDESLVRAVAAAAGLQLENERLQAELRSQLEEVRASRARIVEATQEERRRIERDLHDGTQQRLVSIAMTLGLAEARIAIDAEAGRRLIAEARAELSSALQELRELSQGIHPGILTERGLGEAVADLALRMHLPVEVEVRLSERLPTPVETAAYYVISEALTNVAKHAQASKVRVRVGREDGEAHIAVSDDGRGGADAWAGSGLRGLRDRVEALGGRFALDSPAGAGTSIAVEIPCA